MLRTFNLLCLVFCCQLTAKADDPKAWKTFDSPDGLFSIRLPTVPIQQKGEPGMKNPEYVSVSEELDCKFEIACDEPPKLKEGQTIEKLFEEKIASHKSENEPLKMTESKIYKWKDKYPAFNMTLAFPKIEGKEAVIKSLVVVTPKHFVGVRITGAKASIEGKQVAECLESLTIKE